MRVKVLYRTPFLNQVFGGADIIKNWPEIEATGVEVQEFAGVFYIVKDGKPVHDTAFFTKEEMECLTIIDPSDFILSLHLEKYV